MLPRCDAGVSACRARHLGPAGEFNHWRAGSTAGDDRARDDPGFAWPRPMANPPDQLQRDLIEMARPQLILPQADAACGKIFFADRRTADGHRIALEVWNRATGQGRQGYRLAVYRCKRCAGFHIGQRPIDRSPIPRLPRAGSRKVRFVGKRRRGMSPNGKCIIVPSRLVLNHPSSGTAHPGFSPGPPAEFLLKSMAVAAIAAFHPARRSRGPDHCTPHERPDPHRVDRRDLEPDPGLHQDQPGLRALLCRDVRRAVPGRARASLRAGLRPADSSPASSPSRCDGGRRGWSSSTR